jgi:lipopolysaccharide cholinephosphotransferase
MFSWLTEFINKNGLRYYVVGGTMRGAVRHEGFIPWDDDIDIGMPRADYEKLIELLKEPVEHYVIESTKSDAKDYLYSYAKLYDLNTTMTELVRKKVVRGVYVDIFPLDGIGNTEAEAAKNYKKVDRKNMLLAMKVCRYRKERKWWKNAAVFLGRLIPVNTKKLTRSVDSLCAKMDYDEYKQVGLLVSTYRHRELMPKEVYGVPTEYNFEGIKVFGPEKADEYLTRIYKDWRKLPPEDKRHSAHDFIDLDLNKPYKEI